MLFDQIASNKRRTWRTWILLGYSLAFSLLVESMLSSYRMNGAREVTKSKRCPRLPLVRLPFALLKMGLLAVMNRHPRTRSQPSLISQLYWHIYAFSMIFQSTEVVMRMNGAREVTEEQDDDR